MQNKLKSANKKMPSLTMGWQFAYKPWKKDKILLFCLLFLQGFMSRLTHHIDNNPINEFKLNHVWIW